MTKFLVPDVGYGLSQHGDKRLGSDITQFIAKCLVLQVSWQVSYIVALSKFVAKCLGL